MIRGYAGTCLPVDRPVFPEDIPNAVDHRLAPLEERQDHRGTAGAALKRGVVHPRRAGVLAAAGAVHLYQHVLRTYV